MINTEMEQMFAWKDGKSYSQCNYVFPFINLKVTSNSPYVLRYLNFFFDHFRSMNMESSTGDFDITLLVDEGEHHSIKNLIFHKCDNSRLTRVCHRLLSGKFLFEDGNLYFSFSKRVFGTLMFKDREGLMIFDQASVFDEQPLFSFFRLFIFMLTEILASMNCVMLHAAALKGSRGGVCLVGKSGAGKTTFLLGLLRTGRYKFLGDELCLVQYTKKGCRIGSLTPMVNVPLQSLQYFEELQGYTHETAYSKEGKMHLDPRKCYPNSFKTSCTPTFILFLEHLLNSPAALKPIGSFDALNNAVENTFMPLNHEYFLRNLNIVNELIQQAKTFQFVRSPMLEDSVSMIESVVEYL